MRKEQKAAVGHSRKGRALALYAPYVIAKTTTNDSRTPTWIRCVFPQSEAAPTAASHTGLIHGSYVLKEAL